MNVTPGVVHRRKRVYQITDFGRAAIERFLDPHFAVELIDLGPDDRATVTIQVIVTGDPTLQGLVAELRLDIPAVMLGEVQKGSDKP